MIKAVNPIDLIYAINAILLFSSTFKSHTRYACIGLNILCALIIPISANFQLLESQTLLSFYYYTLLLAFSVCPVLLIFELTKLRAKKSGAKRVYLIGLVAGAVSSTIWLIATVFVFLSGDLVTD